MTARNSNPVSLPIWGRFQRRRFVLKLVYGVID